MRKIIIKFLRRRNVATRERLSASKMWVRGEWKRSALVDRVTNEEVLQNMQAKYSNWMHRTLSCDLVT